MLHPERRGEPHVALDDVAHVAAPRGGTAACARCPCRTRSRSSSSGSMPQARSTRGLTMPQPPHSTQPAPPRVLREPDVELRRRLGEREVRRPQRVRVARRTCARAKWSSVPLQVGHRHALVDGQALDLVEHRRVRRVELVGAVDPARADDVDRRRRARASCGPAPGRCACAAPGRAVGAARRRRCPSSCGPGGRADVERVEVQPLRLELGAVGDLVAHADEDVGDPLGERGERVPGAARACGPRAA